MQSETRAGRRTFLILIVVVAVAAAALAALSIVPPRPDRAVVAISRFAGGVRLLPAGLAFSALPLERRVELPRLHGDAILEIPAVLALPGGAGVPAVVHAQLEGSGPLPISAAAVRERGWDEAWRDWTRRTLTLDQESAQAAVRQSQAWRDVFPEATADAGVDAAAALRSALAPLQVRSAKVVAEPDMALVRSLARGQLREALPPRGRLVVIGLDALDWDLVDELVARGLMPNLGALARRGVQAFMKARPPLLSPLIWTSLATGRPPEVHGVLDFVEPDPGGGPPRPISSLSRKVPALWEMGAAAGRTTTVIGWWATFPANAPPGCTIYSDRLSEQLFGLEDDIPGLADPPDAVAVARRLVVRGSEVTPAMLQPILDVSQAELDAVPPGSAAWDDPIGGAARLMAATLTVMRLTDHELTRGTDLVFSYVEGTDTVGHLFGAYRPPPLAIADPALARRFGAVVDRYYAFVDRWLGRVVAGLGPRDTLVIVADHGFTWGGDRPELASGAHTPTAVFWHRPEGVFLAVGPSLRPVSVRNTLEPVDVTSAVLALAGLPRGSELDGHVPDWLIPVANRQARLAVGYDALVPVGGAAMVELPAAAREEELAKLRALGYLGGDEKGAAAPAPAAAAPVPPTADVNHLEARRLHNLAISRADAGDDAGAESAFKQALDLDPKNARAHLGYGQLLTKLGRWDQADAELWQAIDLGLAEPEEALLRFAGRYRAIGQLDRAGAILARSVERFPDNAVMWLDLGTLAGARGDIELSRQCLERAVSLAPNDPLAHRNLAAALVAAGDRDGARRALTRALELEPGNQEVRRQLAALGGPLR